MRSIAISIGFTLLLGVTAAGAQTSAAPPTPLVVGTGQFTVGADVLVWWLKDSPAPVPLVTDGIVGQPATNTFLGGQSLSTGANPGFRISGDYALRARTGLEGNFFYFGSRSTSVGVESSGRLGSVNLVVPYIDARTNRESGTELSLAPVYRGSATEELSNSLLGAELNGSWVRAPAGPWRITLLGGLRYLRLNETYTLTTQSPYIPPFPLDIWNTTDRFDTTNNFYGAQAGIRARYEQGPFFVDGAVKIALGAMVQAADVRGSLETNDFTNYGATQTFSGGYFALPTSIGNYSQTAFAVVPEVALKLGYRLSPSAALVFGYSFLYASNVIRPGNQVSRTINPTQSTTYTEDPAARLQGAAQPEFRFNESNFWAQGINVGLVVQF